ncbi:MAG: tetratricopeptide repeat protein [Bacteroidales bacterium]|nr:tetratricopeptide repeat protein [Bacteroidales bacterium]MDD4670646.1 tetratricopeptide repeat protein [Bacteroidales bacterium]
MVKKIIFSLLFASLFLNSAFAQYDLDHFYLRGRQALIDGKYSQAIENFNILSRLDSTLYESYFFRGIAKYNLGDFVGAQMDFDKTLKHNPIYTPAYHYRAITLSRIGKYDMALKDLEEAVDLRPSYTGLYFSRGVTYFLSQQFEKAIKDFDMFIRKEPKEGDAYLNRGASYLYLGDTVKALNDYNKAISLNRYDPEGYVRRSRIHAMKNQYEAAIEDLNTALRLDTANTYAYFNRAILKYESKDIQGALSDLDRVLKDEPGNALTLYNRALILAQVGDYVNALDDYDRVLSINPNNVLVYFNRAAVFMELGRYRDAMDDYSKAINLYPDFAKAYMNRSYAKSQLGQFNSSKQDYEIAQKKIREYKAKTSDSTGYEAFADTTRKYDKLLALDAEFAKKDFDNELLQYRDVDIQLKPLYKFVVSESKNHEPALLTRRYDDAELDSFIKSSPISIRFASVKDVFVENGYNLREDVNKSLRTNRSSENLFAKALLEVESKQYNTAMVCYDEAISKSSDNLFYYINRGALQAEMIDFISSIENNVQVLTLDNTKTTKTRVQDQVTRNYDYTSALHDMTKAASIDPTFPYTYYNLGNLYCLSNDLPESISQYTKAIELFPYIGEAYYNRGLVLIYLKDREKGCIDLSKAGELGISDAYSVIKKYCKSEDPD